MKLYMHPLQTSKKSIAIADCNFLQMIELEMCWMVAKTHFSQLPSVVCFGCAPVPIVQRHPQGRVTQGLQKCWSNPVIIPWEKGPLAVEPPVGAR